MRLITIAVLAAAALPLAPSASHATFSAPQQRLLILTEASGTFGLRLLGPGSESFELVAPLGVGGSAAMSADGKHIALNFSVPFEPEPGDAGDLIASDFLGIEGGGLIAGDTARGGRPAWSPDGAKVAYSAKVNGKWNIFVAARSGTDDPVNLTNDAVANDRNPRWAPDGHAIAFESDRTGNWEVFSMAPNGTGQTDLTNNAAEERLGDWSPGSDRLVFSSTRTGGGDLYVMPGNGGSATQLTRGAGADTHAAWSPDGATIAFSNDAEGNANVWEVAPDGTNLRRITNNGYVDLVQDWQPLQDTHPPVVRALASTGRRGHTIHVRYRISEDSSEAAVLVDLHYETKHGFTEAGTDAVLNGVRSGHTYTAAFPAGAVRGAPSSFRFCVQALDGSLNQSARSCARFHFLKPKKR